MDEDFLDRLETAQAAEDGMLDFTASARRPNSRLSCRLQVTDTLDGLVVRLPERQN